MNAERLALSTSLSALVREPCNGTHNACDRSHPTCLCGGPDHFASVFLTDCGHITTFMQCQEDAPLLETLSIRIFHSMEEDTYSSPPLPRYLNNGHPPRLRYCSLTASNFGRDHRLISRLRLLKLDGYFNTFTPSVNTLLGILRECPELEELALQNISSVDSESCSNPTPVKGHPPSPRRDIILSC